MLLFLATPQVMVCAVPCHMLLVANSDNNEGQNVGFSTFKIPPDDRPDDRPWIPNGPLANNNGGVIQML